MMHLNDETIRSFLDSELEAAQLAEAESHIHGCKICTARLNELRARAERVGKALDAGIGRAVGSPQAAYARLQPRLISQPSGRRARARHPARRWSYAWGAGAAVIVLAVIFSFPAVRAWAGEFLGLFRVQQITVLPVDVTRLSALSQDSPLATQISQLLSSSVTMTRKAGPPRQAEDATQASQLAGFDLHLPANQTSSPLLIVQSGEAFTVRIDQPRAQSLIEAAGFPDVQLPPSVDGATISVDIPTAVTAGYGSCPALQAALSDSEGPAGSPGRQYIDCILLVEMPSPTVSTPPDLDIEQLAEIGLQFTGMTAEQAHQYSQTVDWTSTLVIPIPRNGASYKKVSVDGVNGYLIQRPTDDAPQFALVWVKKGIIYAIGGLGNKAQQALDMANAMP
jgi:anti-sigma factor RsiW